MNEPSMSLLVIGGARSGKSRYAQGLAERCGLDPVFIATAQAFDDEMAARIRLHVASRDDKWHTVEAPSDLAGALASWAAPTRILLIDCLTLWLSNVMLGGEDLAAAATALADLVPRLTGPAIFVSNEVGAGIVPDNALARSFRDAQGRLNQQMAAACQAVVLVAAGLPLQLKPRPAPAIAF